MKREYVQKIYKVFYLQFDPQDMVGEKKFITSFFDVIESRAEIWYIKLRLTKSTNKYEIGIGVAFHE